MIDKQSAKEMHTGFAKMTDKSAEIYRVEIKHSNGNTTTTTTATTTTTTNNHNNTNNNTNYINDHNTYNDNNTTTQTTINNNTPSITNMTKQTTTYRVETRTRMCGQAYAYADTVNTCRNEAMHYMRKYIIG